MRYSQYSNIATGVTQPALTDLEFWSDDFDFTNNLWLDKSGKDNHASLTGGFCIEILDDVTLTLLTAKIGATITKVNDSELLTSGVSVNGSGHIEFDFSELTVTANKIWNVFLSTGEEFRFTSGISPYVWASANRGVFGGTETTEWQWSTTDLAHLNLRYGFSKYPAAINKDRLTANYPTVPHSYPSENKAWKVSWTGNPFTDSSKYKAVLFTWAGTTSYTYCCIVDRKNNKIRITNRNDATGEAVVNASELSGMISVRIEYNGNGFGTLTNHTLYLNDTLITLTPVSATNEDRASGPNYWGNGNQSSITLYGVIRDYYWEINDVKFYGIKDGLLCDYNLQSGTYYPEWIYIPVFGELDALGGSVLNPAYDDAHNESETKIKLAEDADLISNDINNILFDGEGNANAIIITDLECNVGNKIHIDNHIDNKYYNLIVTNSEIDLGKFVNGYENKALEVYFRMDGAEETKLVDLLTEQDAKISVHGQGHTDAKFDDLFDAGQMRSSWHEIHPCFYRYKNYSEGLVAYNLASDESKAAEGVMENQGQIGCYGTLLERYELRSAYYIIVNLIHGTWGYPYPDGVTPSETDDNGDWWEWVLDAVIWWFEQNDRELDEISFLGSLPPGHYIGYHPEFLEMFYSKKSWPVDFDDFDLPPISLSDDLANDVSIFQGAENDSIVEDGGVKCQKLSGYETTAYGNLFIESGNWMNYLIWKVEFFVKVLQTENGNPFSSISFMGAGTGGVINFEDEEIKIGDSYTYDNPLELNTWYKIVLGAYTRDNYLLIIYQGDTCVLMSDAAGRLYNNLTFRIDATGVDVLIKDVDITAFSHREFRELQSGNIAVGSDVYSYTYADAVEEMKQEMARKWANGEVPFLFTHYITDPAEKAEDGTAQGILNRSYNLLTELAEFANDNDANWVYRDTEITYPNRINHFINSNFLTTMYGYSGEIWGWKKSTNNIVVNAEETAASSFDGTNIITLPLGESITNIVIFKTPGVKWLTFWVKGQFDVVINQYTTYEYRSQENQYTKVSYTKMRIPVIVEDNYCPIFQFKITAVTETYLHKLILDDK